MKKLNVIKYVELVVYIAGIIMVDCSQNTGITGGTTETTSARLEGVIYNPDGTKAAEATVNLISANANPYSAKQMEKTIQTKTDHNGAYSIQIDTSGLYNVCAQKMDMYSFTGSIQLSSNKTVDVDDTLKAPGSITGITKISQVSDSTKIAIIVIGTNTYAITDDTSGHFSIPVLAEGEYVLRFMATSGDYMYIDTVVKVVSGKNTLLDHIVGLSKYVVPTVGPVSAEFDSNMMKVNVSWPEIDSSKVSGFTITRSCNGNDSQLAILGNLMNSYLDDVFMLKAATVSYSVAAVGIDRSLSAAAISPIVKIEKMNMPDDSIQLDPTIASTKNPWGPLNIDKEHNVYLTSLGWLGKFNSSGYLVAEFAIDSMFYENKGVLNIDDNGNVYVFDAYHSKVYKLSPELKMLKSISVEENTNLILLDNITTDTYGHVYMFWKKGSETIVKTFNTDLVMKNTNSIPSSSLPPFAINDTVYVFKAREGYFSYSIDGKLINSWEFENNKDGATSLVNGLSYFHRLSTEKVMVVFNDSRSIFKLDKNLKVIGRFHLNGLVFQCDSYDHLCNYNRTNQKVLFYKIP